MPTSLYLTAILLPASIFAVLAQPVPIPAGTTVSVRTIDAIDSKTAEVGASFKASLDAPLRIAGKEVASKGAEVALRLTESKDAGKLAGKAGLTVSLVAVAGARQQYSASGANVSVESGGKGKSSAKKIGFGSAIGAGIGAKGAAIGAGAGAAAGTVVAVVTGPEVRIPSEAVLVFKVE